MTEDLPDNTKELINFKIFPRNLTSRADYLVNGNPVSSRTESSVGNCFPGLDFDDRNLEKTFFPGLIFEFHRSDGAILYEIKKDETSSQLGLRDDDLFFRDQQGFTRRSLYLWGIYGLMSSSRTNSGIPEFITCSSLEGRSVWRQVRDLNQGRILIVIGPRAGINDLRGGSAPRLSEGILLRNIISPVPSGFTDNSTLGEFFKQLYDSGESRVIRSNDGSLDIAFLVGEREVYLDEEGVLNIDSYPPGELTRTMCCPWQYDFRDCGCFYWAGMKPDVVAGEQLDENNEPKYPYLNYQRSIESRKVDPPPTDIPNMYRRRDREIQHGEMFDAWNDVLPVVLNDRESEEFVPPPAPVPTRLMTRQEVIDELVYLATVEHALCVEYLYAHYSLNAPKELPQTGVDNITKQIFIAANYIFMIAVDEMRHLRWVNEALALLGHKPSIDRAIKIGRQLNEPFALKPLTREQLEWFIKVEEPSRAINEGIDGMYVSLLASIDNQPNEFPERELLIDLIKFIIDEGGDHFERFKLIKQTLEGIDATIYLRDLEDAEEGSIEELDQRNADTLYETILLFIIQSFSLGDKVGGIYIKNAVRAMLALHDVNHLLASRGIKPSFTLPSPLPEPPSSPEMAHKQLDEMYDSIVSSLSKLKSTEQLEEKIMAVEQEQKISALFQDWHKLIDKEQKINECEVIVFGAGIAGLSIAKLLANSGWRVKIFTSQSHGPFLILNKVTCNLFFDIWPEVVDLFANSVYINKRNVKWGYRSKVITLEQPSIVIRSDIVKERLMKALIDYKCNLVDIHDSNDDLNYTSLKDEYSNYYIIDATGKSAVISRGLGNAMKNSLGNRHIISAIVSLTNPIKYQETWIETTDKGWLFFVPLEENIALVQTMIPSFPYKPSNEIEDIINNTTIIRNLSSCKPCSNFEVFKSSPQITNPLCGKNWLSLGDAAISLDPLSGDGTGYALRGAILAAAIIKAIYAGYNLDDCLEYYKFKIHNTFLSHLSSCIEYYSSAFESIEWKHEIKIMNDYLYSNYDANTNFKFKLYGFNLELI